MGELIIKAIFLDPVGTSVYIRKTTLFEDVSNYLLNRGYEISSWQFFLDCVLWRLNVEVDKEDFKDLIKMFEKHRYVLYPSAVRTFSQVKDLGLKIAIIRDDVQLDVSVPKKLGMYTILLDWQLSYSGIIADMIASNLEEVVKIIKNLIS